MIPTVVFLTDEELKLADSIGNLRQDESEKDGRRAAHGFNGNERACHVLGARGELAVAKALGLQWDATVNTFHNRGDVGDIEVRTRTNHSYDLLVRADDADDRRFVLVIGIDRVFSIYGWKRGADAKLKRWIASYGNRPEAYFVPKDRLEPLHSLLEPAACAS